MAQTPSTPKIQAGMPWVGWFVRFDSEYVGGYPREQMLGNQPTYYASGWCLLRISRIDPLHVCLERTTTRHDTMGHANIAHRLLPGRTIVGPSPSSLVRQIRAEHCVSVTDKDKVFLPCTTPSFSRSIPRASIGCTQDQASTLALHLEASLAVLGGTSGCANVVLLSSEE